MAKAEKTYTIRKTHKGRDYDQTGTLDELKQYYSYTLECGISWMKKRPADPKSGAALVKLLNKCVQETQGCCYEQDYYELIG